MKNYILIFILCLIDLVSNAQTANDYFIKAKEKVVEENGYLKAIEELTKAIELEPNIKYYKERAYMKRAALDSRGAIEDFTEVIKLDSNTVLWFDIRGELKRKIDDYKGSIEDYTKAIELEPNNKYYRERAFSKYFFDDNHGAIVDFTKAIKLDSTDELSYRYRGKCKFYVADYRGAIVDFTKVIKIKPDYYDIADCYFQRGKCKAGTDDYRGAIEDYTKAIKLEPDNSEIYINRGLAKLNLGIKNSGCLDFSKAGELGEKEAYKFITKHCNNKF
jgi:tetratricopeptide (TPR) repeat protein